MSSLDNQEAITPVFRYSFVSEEKRLPQDVEGALMHTYGDAFQRIGRSNAIKNMKWILTVIQNPLATQNRHALSMEILAFAQLNPFDGDPRHTVRILASRPLPHGFGVPVEKFYTIAKEAVDALMGKGIADVPLGVKFATIYRASDAPGKRAHLPVLWVGSDELDQSALPPHMWRTRLAVVLRDCFMVTNKIGRCADPTCHAPLFVRTRRDGRYCCRGHRVRVNQRNLRQRQKRKTGQKEARRSKKR